jgi:hypothetical protein
MTASFLDWAHQRDAEQRAIRHACSQRGRLPAKAEKAIAERQKTLSWWRQGRRKQIETLLNGPHGEEARELVGFLKGLELGQARQVIAHAETWRHADADTRYLVLSMISAAITSARTRAGLIEFDDPLPGRPDNLFLLIRRILVSV